MCYAEKGIWASLCNLEVSWVSSLSISSLYNPPHWPRTAIWLHTGSWCLCLEMVPFCQGCIIQILCFSKAAPPWGGAVATPNAPVHCYKISESGIPLSCWLRCFLCNLTGGHKLAHFLLFMYSKGPTGMPFPLVIQFRGEQQAALIALFVMFSVPKEHCCWVTNVFCVSVCSC